MFDISGVFAEIAKESTWDALESSWRDAKKFKHVSFVCRFRIA
jgi:hypothetical protein